MEPGEVQAKRARRASESPLENSGAEKPPESGAVTCRGNEDKCSSGLAASNTLIAGNNNA